MHRGPAGYIVHLYSEADACRRETRYQSPEWRMQATPDWQTFVRDYAGWYSTAFGIQPFARRPNAQPWLKDISLVVILHGMTHDGKVCHTFDQMAARLEQLADHFPPQKTLIKMVGFEGPIDRRWPDTLPAPELGGEAGFGRLVNTAQQLGYRLIPHLNVWGASFSNPRTAALLPYQIHDQEDHPSTWSFDYDQDEIGEEIFAYISPDTKEWREVVRENIQGLVARGVSAIYLDQTGTFINDARHNHFRGLTTLYSELAESFPSIQLAGEGPTHEVTAGLCALVCGISTFSSARLAEMYRLLFGPYIRQYGYNQPPEPYRGVWGAPDIINGWKPENFLRYEEYAERVHGIPSLNITDHRIDLTNDLVQSVLDRARRYRMVD